MKTKHIVLLSWVLAAALGALYFSAAKRPAALPGDFRDAPGSGAYEQLGGGDSGAPVPAPAAPSAAVQSELRSPPKNGGGAVIYKGRSYYPPVPSPGEAGFRAGISEFEDKAITELSIINHADGQSGRILLTNAAALRFGAREGDYITAGGGKFLTGSRIGNDYTDNDFTEQMDAKLAPNAVINLIGCGTGGMDVKSVNSSLAAKVSAALPGRTVIAFVGSITPHGILILELGGITRGYSGKAIVSCVDGTCKVIDSGGMFSGASRKFDFPLR